MGMLGVSTEMIGRSDPRKDVLNPGEHSHIASSFTIMLPVRLADKKNATSKKTKKIFFFSFVLNDALREPASTRTENSLELVAWGPKRDRSRTKGNKRNI